MPTRPNQTSSADALAAARHHGRERGARAKGLGVDCPYRFDVIDLRQQWFAGFSEGRTLLRQVLLLD